MKEAKTLCAGLDLLPENKQYRDEGCELAPSCLDCPLPRCVLDAPRGRAVLYKRRRDEEIVRACRHEGLSRAELAERFDISQRTVQRVLKAHGITKPSLRGRSRPEQS